MKQRRFARFLSLLLALVLCIGMLPVSAVGGDVLPGDFPADMGDILPPEDSGDALPDDAQDAGDTLAEDLALLAELPAPRHHYEFNALADGKFADSATGAEAVAGKVSGAVTLEKGRNGSAAKFGGGHVEVNDVPSNSLAALTVTAWVNWAGFNARGQSGTIFSNGELWFNIDKNDHKLNIGYHDTSGGWPNLKGADGVIDFGDWAHVAFVKTANSLALYLNGVEIAKETVGIHADVRTTAPRIGENFGNHDFNGLIDDVRIFSGALTAAEIKGIYDIPADVTSSLGKTDATILSDIWGTADVAIPVTFGEGDSVDSIRNGETALVSPADYTADANGITLKKEYIAGQDAGFRLDIAFTKGSEAVFSVTKIDTTVHEYVWTPDKGLDEWTKLKGDGTFVMEDDGMHITGEAALLNTAAPAMVDGEIEITFDQKKDNSNLGFLFRSDATMENWQAVRNEHYMRWRFTNSAGTTTDVYGDGTFVTSRDGEADTKLKIRFENGAVSLWLDDQFMVTTVVANAVSASGLAGLYTRNTCDMVVKKVTFRNFIPLVLEEDTSADKTITADGMTVNLATDFPRVKNYTLNAKTMNGAEFKYNYATINSVNYPATAKISAESATSITYTVTPAGGAASTFDVVYTVQNGHILEMRINNIVEKNGELVYSLNLPNQPLLSANSTQEGAKLDATTFTPILQVGESEWDQTKITDEHFTVSENKIRKNADMMGTLAFVSADGLSAAITNNVLYNVRELRYRAFDLPTGGVTAGVWNSEFMYRGLDKAKIFPIASEPDETDLYCRVILTEDTNGDSQMDWQDGANALKLLVGDRIPGGDKAARSFFQVGYNFVSEVQQPFLKVGDNLKRMSNLIDGFGQNLVLKGYANEGHDSGHSDYDDINKRAGGAEDLNLMTEAIKEINATFGIHINHSECYPEAKMFNDHVMTDENAWSWMDQSKEMRRDVDIMNTREGQRTMDQRLDSMFAKAPGIDFVYVDTYGDDRWAETRLADNLVGNGAMIGTENKIDLDRYASWVHWPGISSDGMHHFVYNQQKDIYNGSGLFWGGYSRADSFMSWQHRTDINVITTQFYTNQLPQKYLMCHDVVKQAGNRADFTGNVYSTSDYKIYKDGNMIADGKKIFIPWYAEDSVTKNPDEAAKIYHWNDNGGETTWTIPLTWSAQNLKTVKLYQSTQAGRVFLKDLDVSEANTITITATAKTPYVVYPGAAAPDTTDWSTGSPIKDTSFNSRDFSIWEKTGTADIQMNDNGDGVSILTMEGTDAGQVSQTMTGLVPGQKYRAVVWAGSANGKTARITVTDGGKTYMNYVDQTVRANNCYDTYARNMWVDRVWVDFVATGTTATITLSADACAAENGKATFMETRIVKTAEQALPTGDPTKIYVANETFEYIEQGGTGIFTPEGGGDGGYHLSETNLPYTSDTISANGSKFSLKMYGYGRAQAMRTRPSSMRLAPNTEYIMEFDTLGGGTVYIVSEKDGSDKPLTQSFAEGHSTITFTTGAKADYIARLTGCNVLDNFAVYQIVDETPPTTPNGLTARVEENARVILTWLPASDADTAISGYKIYRDGTLLTTVGNALTCTDTTVSADTGYSYQVSAVNAGGTEGEKSKARTAYVGNDMIAPTVENVVLNSLTKATLTFSEVLDKTSAETAANYKISGGATVSAAVLGEDGKTVNLTLAGLSATGISLMHVTGVKDLSGANATIGDQRFPLSALAHYFKFDEAAGEPAHDFTGREDGVKSDKVKSAAGKNGSAAQFEKNGYVDVSGDALLGQHDYTLSAWVKWGGASDESQTIFSNGASGDGESYGVWLYVGKDGKIVASFKNNQNDYTNLQSGNTSLTSGTWAHVAFVRRADGHDLYINGVKVGTDNIPVDVKGYNNKIRIGGNYNNGNSLLHKFNGAIDEAKVFTAALTAEDVAALAAATFAPAVIGDEFIVSTAVAAPLTVSIDYNGTKLLRIEDAQNAPLTEGDYELTASGVVFTPAFLAALSVGTHEFTLKLGAPESAKLRSEPESATITITKKAPILAVDRTALMGVIHKAKSLIAGGIADPALQTALDAAVLTASNPDLTAAEVATAAALLQAVIDTLCPPVIGVTLNTAEALLYVSDTMKLTATVAPANAADKSVYWTSDNSAVATVDETGVVTAVSNGTAIITVTTVDGGFTATCTVTVTTEDSSTGRPDKGTTVTNEDGSKTTTKTDKRTGTVTATTKYPDGKTVAAVTKKNGDKTIAVTSKDGEKVAELNLPAVVPAPEVPFTDVAEDFWAKEAIDTVTGLKLFTGTGEGIFSGENSMTRGMLTTVLHRLSGELKSGENTFADVPADAWFTGSVAWAAQNGIVTGNGDGFDPEGNITRESLAVMLYRYAGVLGLDTKADAAATGAFSDSAKVSDWASDAMNWAVEAGILKGSDNALNPGGTATRNEVAVMLQRLVETLKK